MKAILGFLVGAALAVSARAGEHPVARRETAKKEARPEHIAPAATEDEKWYDKFDLSFWITGVLQGSAGANKNLSREEDVTDASVALHLDLSAPVVEHGMAYVHLEAGDGDGIDGDIPTLSGLNDTANDDANVSLSEAWYEHRFLAERLALKIGKIDLCGPCGRHESAFDANAVANDECSQFLSAGFINNLAVELPDDNGFGVTLWASPHEMVDIGIGVADADGDWENVFDNTFSMLEFDFKLKVAGRQGNYRIYGWLNDKSHTDIGKPTKADEEGYGFGLSFDQELNDSVTVFARYGWQRDNIYQVEHAWSVGLQFSGQRYGRADDRFGLAYGMAIIGDDWEDAAVASGTNTGDEHHVEFYYNFKLNKHAEVSPDIQWVKNPDGDADNDDIWAFGLRVQLQF